MSIKPINEATWSEILKLQAEAYALVDPESLEVLKSKWLCSPECCFVYEKAGNVIGYLLAHSWNKDTPPKLFQALPVGSEGTILFLHDLAISSTAAGHGLGKKMVGNLLNIAKNSGFQQIRLVAVQDSSEFWKKQGFSSLGSQAVDPSYGVGAQLMLHELST
ncbi:MULTISPECIES: GNAT family N-acetyltransferase [unclassified Agarivorans]|uniref:GNAT family N-acetyltransferase n=1 Tax=unclassified Agarivorans TaxID=2636026 RepID=UPI003D7D7FBF